MRVAFVVNNYPPRVGGVEMHVSSLADELAARGHDVFVHTLEETQGRTREEGVTVNRHREYLRIGGILGFPAWGTTRRIAAQLRADSVDVVSVHTRFFPMSWVGLRAARRAGARVIHTEHGSGHVVSPSAVIRWGSRAVDLTIGKAVLRGADGVLGVSEHVLEFVHRLSGVRAEVFYNAIDPPETSDAEPEPGAATRLVFVGRLVSGKGWDDFIRMVAALRTEGHAITAEMLGDGPDRADADALVRSLGLEDTLVLKGRVSPEEVRRSIRGAILVNPTTLAEGFQTTLLEALAEGGRIVTYDVPGAEILRSQGHPVTVVDGRTASSLIVATNAVLSTPSPDARSDRPSLEEWYWPSRAQQFIDLCDALVSGRP